MLHLKEDQVVFAMEVMREHMVKIRVDSIQYKTDIKRATLNRNEPRLGVSDFHVLP